MAPIEQIRVVAGMQTEIVQLRAEIVYLRAENERLKAERDALYAACKALRTAADDAASLIYSCDLPPLLKAIRQADAAIAKADGQTTREPSQP